MRDDDFDFFISNFGEKTLHIAAPSASIERWRGVLPRQLLDYWSQEGWSAYSNGLFWITNPDELEDTKDAWLQGTALKDVDDFHVIARSAFGDLYLWGRRSGQSVTICTQTHSIICIQQDLKKEVRDPDDAIRGFFASLEPGDCDFKDEYNKPLFERALRKLGPLATHELYGFEPALALGGSSQLSKVSKLDMNIYLDILRSIEEPSIPYSDADLSS